MSHAGASSSPFFLNPYLFSLANPWAQTCYGIKIVPPRSAPLVLLLRLTVAGCVLGEVLGRAHGFFWYSSNFVFFLNCDYQRARQNSLARRSEHVLAIE